MCRITLLFTFFNVAFLVMSQSNVYERTRFNSNLAPFYHGVASGDPLSDKVIIWTRFTPDSAQSSVVVEWEMATDTGFVNMVNSGNTTTNNLIDYTVKVDVGGLQSNTWYYYRFKYGSVTSLIGRTRTAPSGPVDSLRFAVVSCADYVDGYFHGYARIVEANDIDAVIHLGDYIYENGASGSIGREHDPPYRITELNDYRQRYSQYRLDADLRCLHQMYPFINIWDDHDVAANAWNGGASGHDSITDGNWDERKAAAAAAFFEWLPVRKPDLNDSLRIYRKSSWGDLLDFYMCDARVIGRDQQNSGAIDDTTRSMIGGAQLSWLSTEMKNSNAQWKIMAQQVMMAPLEVPFNGPYSSDSWDGYRAERSRLYDTVLTHNIKNFVVLTGDIHSAWANNLEQDSNKIGVEFISPSITTDNEVGIGESSIQFSNSHVKYVELDGHGYYRLDVNTTRCQADFYFAGDVIMPLDNSETAGPYWYTIDGSDSLAEASSASVSRPSVYVAQPPKESFSTSNLEISNQLGAALIGAYPNPFWAYLYLKMYIFEPQEVNVETYNMLGELVQSKSHGTLARGLHYIGMEGENLSSGNYLVKIIHGNKTFSRNVVKY